MKLSRPLTVLAAVTLLAGGTAMTVNAATATDPVLLCSNVKNGAVTLPSSSGECGRGTTAFHVASDRDVEALGVRLDAAEAAAAARDTTLGEHAQDIAALTSQNQSQAQTIQALQAANAALARRVDALHPPSIRISTTLGFSQGHYGLVIEAESLKPGAALSLGYVVNDFADQVELGHRVDADGILRATIDWVPCDYRHVRITSHDAQGNWVSSNVVHDPGEVCG